MDLHRDAPNFFAGPYVDRRSEARAGGGLARRGARREPDTLYVVAVGTTQLVQAAACPMMV